jgi:hypothetical protein
MDEPISFGLRLSARNMEAICDLANSAVVFDGQLNFISEYIVIRPLALSRS